MPKPSLQTCWLLREKCTGLWCTFYFITKKWVWEIVYLFKIHFVSLLPLWNALYKQMNSERRAKHLASTKGVIWSWSVVSPLCKFVLHSLRLQLSICQNTVVLWGQKGWRKANLTVSYLYVCLKRLIREMGLAQVWHQSNQNTAATWNSWSCYRDGQSAMCSRLPPAPSQSDMLVTGEASLRSQLCTSWFFPLCMH